MVLVISNVLFQESKAKSNHLYGEGSFFLFSCEFFYIIQKPLDAFSGTANETALKIISLEPLIILILVMSIALLILTRSHLLDSKSRYQSLNLALLIM